MLTSLLSLVRSQSDKPALDFLMTRMLAEFGDGFSVFADCGAGIGSAALTYNRLLDLQAKDKPIPDARIVCYEPLPENRRELTARTQAMARVTIRPFAVSDTAGTADFTVPRRMVGTAAVWGPGTSATGFIGRKDGAEIVKVDVVRLEDEPFDRFDFVKMDLQGGEAAALNGLGSKLAKAKMLFVEQQLLGAPVAPEPMSLLTLIDAGFVCFYDDIQFGMVSNLAEVPIGLMAEGGMSVTRILMPDGRGLPFSGRAEFMAKRAPVMNAHGIFDPAYVAAIKKAGVHWIATDILAVHKDVFPTVSTWL